MDFVSLVADISVLYAAGASTTARTVDRLLTLRSWLTGAWIIEFEQRGEDRAAYGEALIDRLAEALSLAGVKGAGRSNLRNFRQLALVWPDLDPRRALLAVAPEIHQTTSGEFALTIRQTASGESLPPFGQSLDFPAIRLRIASIERLSWQDAAWTERLFNTASFSHLLELSRMDVPIKRAFYELHVVKEGWPVRELRRQIDSMLYERVGLSKDKTAVMALSRDGALRESPATILRDPYVLEFLGLPEPSAFTEAQL